MSTSWLQRGGARVAHAGAAVTSALRVTEIVVVAAAEEHQPRVAAQIHREVAARRGTRALPVEKDRAAWLGEFYDRIACPAFMRAPFGSDLVTLDDLLTGLGTADPTVRRAVLVWSDLDAFIWEAGRRFEEVAEVLSAAMVKGRRLPWRPYAVHQAVLIGERRLMERVDRLARMAERRDLRLRSIVVR